MVLRGKFIALIAVREEESSQNSDLHFETRNSENKKRERKLKSKKEERK